VNGGAEIRSCRRTKTCLTQVAHASPLAADRLRGAQIGRDFFSKKAAACNARRRHASPTTSAWCIDRKITKATLRPEQTNEMRIGVLDTIFQSDLFTQRDVNYIAQRPIDSGFHLFI
jgi:hypothetical protein